MESQGWTPGDLLGGRSAQPRKLHTSISTAQIRVTLKDDNLGLGARAGGEPDCGSVTGLDSLQSILGRLNGKSEEELSKAQDARFSAQRSAFVNHRWGTLPFVSGGLLVRDGIDPLSNHGFDGQTLENGTIDIPKTLPLEGSGPGNPCLPGSLTHREKRKTDLAEQPGFWARTTIDRLSTLPTEDQNALGEETSARTPKSSYAEAVALPNVKKSQRKARRAERKLRRKPKRDKLKKQISIAAADPPLSNLSGLQPPVQALQRSEAPQTVANGRKAVRQRQIQQKRMSMMDGKALNEVSRYSFLSSPQRLT